MADILGPRDGAEVEQAIRWALAGGKALELVGHGSKRAIGRAAQWDATLDLSALSGVTLYEPAELVLSAKAGTPLAEIEALLAASRQELAFEPIDYGPLLGTPAGTATIGGVLAANLSGPRRIKAGAARDHFLGVCAVSGRGEAFKSGGRVVKNVTGYDLCKLLAGSWGTLAAMTELTIKTLPRAETEQTILVLKLDDATAARAMNTAMCSYAGISAAAHLSGHIASRITEVCGVGGPVTVFRLEGVAASVAHRKGLLEHILTPFGELGTLQEAASRPLWRAIRDVTPFVKQNTYPATRGEGRIGEGDPGSDKIDVNRSVSRPSSTLPREENAERSIWRISTAPSCGTELGRRLAERAGAEVLYDWAGGLVWAAVPPSNDAAVALVRSVVRAAGGHARLIRAPAAVRAAIDVFEPEPPPLAALTKRLRESFDPKGVLNAGRMWAGV